MVKLKDIRIGSIVTVKSLAANESVVKARVTGKSGDIKNGISGINFHPIDAKGNTCRSINSWAYLSQVQEIVKK